MGRECSCVLDELVPGGGANCRDGGELGEHVSYDHESRGGSCCYCWWTLASITTGTCVFTLVVVVAAAAVCLLLVRAWSIWGRSTSSTSSSICKGIE